MISGLSWLLNAVFSFQCSPPTPSPTLGDGCSPPLGEAKLAERTALPPPSPARGLCQCWGHSPCAKGGHCDLGAPPGAAPSPSLARSLSLSLLHVRDKGP